MANPIIQAGGLLSNHSMEVTFLDVRLSDPRSAHPGGRRVPFRQIDCVLLSTTNQLSLRIGRDYFSIPIKPNDAAHQAAIDALLAGLTRD